jgi:hypothetical protein
MRLPLAAKAAKDLLDDARDLSSLLTLTNRGEHEQR